MSRLDTKALRLVTLVLDSGLSLTEEDTFTILEGYGEVGKLLRTSYVQSFGMDLDKAREFVKFVAQALLIANTIEFDDDYYAVVDAIADASTLWELWEIIEDNFLAGQHASYEDKFRSLANFILDNEELFVRKLSDEDIEAYETGEDEYGDIVDWAERQLAVDVEEIDEDVDEWYEEEYNILKVLLKDNLKSTEQLDELSLVDTK